MTTDTKDPFSHFYRLKKPCKNCPFLKRGAVELRPGRLNGIVQGLEQDDSRVFLCHKTLRPDDDLEGADEHRRIDYEGGEAMCSGAAAYLMKVGRPTITMRAGFIFKAIYPDHWDAAKDMIIDPPADPAPAPAPAEESNVGLLRKSQPVN